MRVTIEKFNDWIDEIIKEFAHDINDQRGETGYANSVEKINDEAYLDCAKLIKERFNEEFLL